MWWRIREKTCTPTEFLEKYPVSEKVIFKPVDPEKFKVILEKYRDIKPSER